MHNLFFPDDFANGKLDSAVSDLAEETTEAVEQRLETESAKYRYQQRGNNLHCKYCDITFISTVEFHSHHLYHVELPSVIAQRLTPAYVQRMIKNKRLKSGYKGRRRNFARKHIRSYQVPKAKKNKETGPLKLTLKLATAATTDRPSFEIVPQKILIGPGGVYSTNGILDEVKSEVFTQSEDVEWNNKTVEGAGEGAEKVEGTQQNLDGTLESLEGNCAVNVERVEQDQSEERIEGEEEVTGHFEEATENEKAVEDPSLNTVVNLKLDDQQQEGRSACPSPSPSEQLRPEFLASEEESSDSLPSPAMVEVSNTNLSEAGSPAFPTTSPAPPQTSGDSNFKHSASEQDQHSAPVTDPQEELPTHLGSRGEESSETPLPSETGNFNWNDIGNVTANATDDPASNSGTVEERDPLMIPEQASADPQHETIGISENLREGSPPDSLLRGFLCDPSTGDKAIPVTTPASGVVGNVIDGLGSEYISLERLGETGALVCCDVCGEQTSNLEEHRARAGHYKCGHQECGNQLFPNLSELASHQHLAHGGSGQPPSQPPQQQQQQQQQSPQQYPMPHHQPPPVQQLAQQVQRLPVPPQQLSPRQMNHHSPQPVVQQMSPQLHQLMPPQQPYPQSQVRRPPPLYRVPPTGSVPGTPQAMQHQYPNHPQQPQQQHMMPPQMYNQQSFPQPQNDYSAPAGSLPPPRTYGNVVQQMNRPRAPSQHSMQRPNIVQQQQQPRMGLQQKRPAVVTNAPSSSPNKQRRMDVLLPDSHDDADCHVIAMQKRTETGPMIGNVQGATNSGRPESMIHLTDSITLSVRQPQGAASAGQPVTAGGKNKSDAKAVANILATRGITVTPAGGTVGRPGAQQSPQQQQRQPRPPPANPSAVPAASQPVTTLNLNSAISIIAQPTGSSPSRQQQVLVIYVHATQEKILFLWNIKCGFFFLCWCYYTVRYSISKSAWQHFFTKHQQV